MSALRPSVSAAPEDAWPHLRAFALPLLLSLLHPNPSVAALGFPSMLYRYRFAPSDSEITPELRSRRTPPPPSLVLLRACSAYRQPLEFLRTSTHSKRGYVALQPTSDRWLVPASRARPHRAERPLLASPHIGRQNPQPENRRRG